MNKLHDKQYLGDGIYVQATDQIIILTTENGIEVGNTIYLDLKNLNDLLDYLSTKGFQYVSSK